MRAGRPAPPRRRSNDGPAPAAGAGRGARAGGRAWTDRWRGGCPASRWRSSCSNNATSPCSASSISTSRQVRVSVDEPSVRPVTWSSTTSARSRPSPSVSRHDRRTVLSSATGVSAWPRLRARTSPTSSAGGSGLRRRASPRANRTRISSRDSTSTGSLRCHPLSAPPRRRRSVTPGRGQVQLGGVDVGGFEQVLVRTDDAADPCHIRSGGQGCRLGQVVLALGLDRRLTHHALRTAPVGCQKSDWVADQR